MRFPKCPGPPKWYWRLPVRWRQRYCRWFVWKWEAVHAFCTRILTREFFREHLPEALSFSWYLLREDVRDRRRHVKRAAPYPGHGVASVMVADDLGIVLTEEEKQAVIWHMGAFAIKDRDLDCAYDAAKLLFPRQIVLTHAADHLAAALEGRDETDGK